jgi:hypothetical protein
VYEVVERTDSAQNTEGGRNVVSSVMNIQGIIKGGEFLDHLSDYELI